MTQLRKKDALLGVIVSEVIAWLAIFNIKIIGQTIPYLWTLPIVLPILSLIGLYIAHLISKKIPTINQVAKFLLVGFSNFFIDFAVLNLLMWWQGIYSGSLIALFNIISFSIAVINSYLWNKLWTFRARDTENVSGEFVQFIAIAVIGAFINTAIVYMMTTYVPISFGLSAKLWANFAKVVATAISLIWNFTGYKFIVFKKDENKI